MIEVRDLRNGDWYWIHKTIIEKYSKKIGAIGLAIYNILASHSNQEGICFPSQKRIADMLDISEWTVGKYVGVLEKYNLIRRERENHQKTIYYLLKIAPLSDQGAPEKHLSQTKKADGFNKGEHLGLTKVNNNNINKNKYNYNSKDQELTDLLYDLVKQNYPFIIERKTEKQKIADYEEMNRINRIDGRDYKIIEFIIRWSQQDDFWKQNIRSVSKLRKQFDTLMIRAKSQVDKKVIKDYD